MVFEEVLMVFIYVLYIYEELVLVCKEFLVNEGVLLVVVPVVYEEVV